MSNIKKALQEATLILKDDAPLEATLLLSHVLNVNRAYLYAHATDELTNSQLTSFKTLVEKRAQGYPIAYLIGYKDFYSLTLRVNESTLIPRPETELLIEKILEHIHKDRCQVLDLGTGSGAIAITLAHLKPHWQIVATDIDLGALDTAKNNAISLGLDNIQWIHSDWFSHVEHAPFDIIVSNPPYLETNDPYLAGDIRFEPQHALTSGADGLTALRIIIQQASHFLKPQGLLLVEHGYQQAPQVIDLFTKNNFQKITSITDFQGHPRVCFGFMPT